jgi:hypothetical protein
MTNLRLISRFAGLSSVLTTALFALRSRGAASPYSHAGAAGSQRALASREPDAEEGHDSPTWPPPEGVYWGM